MQTVLQIEKLSRQFENFTAVDDIDLEVKEGSFFSILGPSGCGKTTLLRMIAGFLEPTSGTLRIRGENMLGVAPNQRPVNLVFQHLALFPMMDVAENIAFGLKQRRISAPEVKRKVASILQRVGLEGYGNKRISQLSGGQRQRVAIARALVLEPSILLLDEPLGALDLKLREQMKIELKKLQSEIGTTFVYITHDQSEALVMSDHVAVMHKGHFEQIDTPRNLYSNPATSFVAGFVGESNRFKATIEQRGEKTLAQTDAGLLVEVASMAGLTSKNCALFIRPEAVMLLPEEGLEGVSRFSLNVQTILFDGSNTKILASLEGSDREITVSLPQNRQFAHIAPGDKIPAGVHVDACQCFAE